MTSVLDLWRWLDPSARLVSGATDRLGRPVRGASRTRAAPPHLPLVPDGHLLIVDAAILETADLDPLVTAIRQAELEPSAVWIAGAGDRRFETGAADLPLLAGERPAAETERRAALHLEREREELATFAASLRLAAAEAALAHPQPGAPAGIVSTRLRRGVAVSAEGELVSLHARPAGRTLATRFAAVHAGMPASRTPRAAAAQRNAEGLWILERPLDSAGTSVTAWLFDDMPFARVDEAALDALAITLRALLRRPAAGPSGAARQPPGPPPATGDALRDTLLAVARANGRIAPAARALGVHRNTVLYRLRRASSELGIDPRRPDDALRLLAGTDRG